VQIYELEGMAIWHFDLYRLKSADEAWELGIEDAFAEGISLIEWPERLGPLLPVRRLEIEFLFGEQPEERRAVLDAGEDWQARLVKILGNA
jgi:tRNA threonylcarbamoyladenosine biosynthesis protein TsaE